MSKKITLKHALPNGEIATRQTARNYTHVVVASRNIERTLAANPLTQAQLDKVAEDYTYRYKYNMNLLKVPVGEKFYYQRGQGGYYLNKSGKHMEVREYQHESAREYYADLFNSAEDCAAHHVAERVREHEKWQEGIKNSKCEEFVNSWHGREDLAEKEASKLYGHGFDVRIEAINNGTR